MFGCPTIVIATGEPGEARPIRAELELHGHAGGDAKGKGNGEDRGPEARRPFVGLIAPAIAEGAEQGDQERQAHRQLREEVVEGDGGGELEPVNGQGMGHRSTQDSGRVKPRSSSDLQVFSRSS